MPMPPDQAQAYMHDNTALSDHEIETEVERFIAEGGKSPYPANR